MQAGWYRWDEDGPDGPYASEEGLTSWIAKIVPSSPPKLKGQ